MVNSEPVGRVVHCSTSAGSNGLDRFVVSGISQVVALTLCIWAVLRAPAGVQATDDDRPAPAAWRLRDRLRRRLEDRSIEHR